MTSDDTAKLIQVEVSSCTESPLHPVVRWGQGTEVCQLALLREPERVIQTEKPWRLTPLKAVVSDYNRDSRSLERQTRLISDQ